MKPQYSSCVHTVCVMQPPRGPAAYTDFTLLTRNHKTAGKYKLCWPSVAVTRLQSCGNVFTNSVLLFWCCFAGVVIFLGGRRYWLICWGQKLGKHCQQRRGSRYHRGECTQPWDFTAVPQSKYNILHLGAMKIDAENWRWVIAWQREKEEKLEAKGKVIKDHHLALMDRCDSWRHCEMHVWFRQERQPLVPVRLHLEYQTQAWLSKIRKQEFE